MRINNESDKDVIMRQLEFVTDDHSRLIDIKIPEHLKERVDVIKNCINGTEYVTSIIIYEIGIWNCWFGWNNW